MGRPAFAKLILSCSLNIGHALLSVLPTVDGLNWMEGVIFRSKILLGWANGSLMQFDVIILKISARSYEIIQSLSLGTHSTWYSISLVCWHDSRLIWVFSWWANGTCCGWHQRRRQDRRTRSHNLWCKLITFLIGWSLRRRVRAASCAIIVGLRVLSF